MRRNHSMKSKMSKEDAAGMNLTFSSCVATDDRRDWLASVGPRTSLLSLSVGHFFYYLGFIALCLWQGFSTTEFEKILVVNIDDFESLMQVIAVTCLALKFFSEPIDFKSGIIAALITALLVRSYFQCGINTLLVTFAFVALGKGVSFKTLAKIAGYIYCALLIITVVFAIAGQIAVVELLREDGRVRYSLGFSHPNRFSTTVFQVLAAWLAVRYPKFRLPELGACIASVIVILAVADSRTTALAILAMAFLIVSARQFEGRGKSKQFIILSGLLVLLVIISSLYFMVSYSRNNSIHYFLNDVLSGRLFLAHGYYSTFPPTLFGRSFNSNIIYTFSSGGSHLGFTVDNTYARIPLLYGLVPMAVFLSGLVFLFRNEYRSGRIRAEFIFLVIFLLVGFSESFMLNISMNFALIAFSVLFKSYSFDLSRD